MSLPYYVIVVVKDVNLIIICGYSWALGTLSLHGGQKRVEGMILDHWWALRVQYDPWVLKIVPGDQMY